MKNIKKAISIAVVLSAVLLLYSCNPLEDKSKSSSLLVVENVLGVDAQGMVANFLQSDVVMADTSGNATVVSDSASVTFRARTLDPAPLMGTSQYNDIIVKRYTVSFTRTDGKNVPGVDVPYPFEGSLSTVVKVNATATASIVLVREVAKLEPPLIRLADGGAEVVLTCTATIDFYGQDLLNNTVKATGYLTVYFANYVDKGK
jgi:hypothetical protein